MTRIQLHTDTFGYCTNSPPFPLIYVNLHEWLYFFFNLCHKELHSESIPKRLVLALQAVGLSGYASLASETMCKKPAMRQPSLCKPPIFVLRGSAEELRVNRNQERSPPLGLPDEVLQKIITLVLGDQTVHIRYLENRRLSYVRRSE